MSKEQLINLELNPDELRYLVSCGTALLQNIPEKSLSTYCHFDKQQIVAFTSRIRKVMDKNELDR